jgi:NAD(P)-dependent dehydrogenase (short-subunit alcohol dehydrogenase family)
MFTHKVALITGAGSGIGRATALLLAQQNVRIGTIDRSQESSDAIANSLSQIGADVIPTVADVSQPDQMEAAIATIGEKFGRIDIVFANAGINGVWAPIEDITPDEWDRTIETNMRGTFLTLKYTVPYLKRQGGVVIITSSVNGTRVFSNTGATAYSCTKAAQVVMAKMLALELAKHRIRVNVVCPGEIQTSINENTHQRNLEGVREPVEFPAGRIPLTDGSPGKSLQVAQLVAFLASDAASHISGTEIWIDGGESLLQG